MKLEYNKDSNVGIAPFGYNPRSKLIITKYIMTPREKAKQLIDKFSMCRDISNTYYVVPIPDDSKQCALIAVNELIKEEQETDAYYEIGSYWKMVKQEIKKL